MFDNLVESTSNKADASRKGGFLAGTFVIYGLLIAAIAIGSIIWYDNSLDAENLELLTELDTPIQTIAEPEPEQEQPKPASPQEVTVTQEIATRVDPTYSTDVPIVPKEASTEAFKGKTVSANLTFTRGTTDSNPTSSGGPVIPGATTGVPSTPLPAAAASLPPPPPPPPKPTPTPAPKPTAPRSGGVLNGKATSLPQPAYPANAKAVRAAGTVAVQVLVDESGRVVTATATSGHPLLRNAAVAAARNAKFSPTLLSGQPVKVTGVINYNFTLQ